MKKKFVLLLSLLSFISFSQEKVKSLNLKLGKRTDIFQVVQEDKNQVSLFLNDKYNVRTLRFNDKFDLIDSLSAERPDLKYDDIVGYSTSKNNYYTYWSSTNNKEIASQCFDFDSKKVSLKTFSLEFVKEKPIEKITINNIFYLITILKNTSILNLYIFNNGEMQKKAIDLTDKTFINWENKKINLWDILNTSDLFQPSLSIQNILNETPPSLTFSTCKRKAYVSGNNLIFTFDDNNNFTQLLNLNLTDFTVTQKLYSQPFIEQTEFNTPETNSFLMDDKLIQMQINPVKLIITIKDLENNEMKSFVVENDKEIDFKNSEIIQEDGKISNTRILDKSNQLLRKIGNLNPSLSCYTSKSKIYLTLGSVSQVQNNNAIIYGAILGGLTGALIGASISSNYSLKNMNSYTNRKVVYINCLFDSNFNHLNEPPKKLAFDQLRAFAEKNNFLKSQTVFKFKNDLYYGGYDKDNSVYSFYKFND